MLSYIYYSIISTNIPIYYIISYDILFIVYAHLSFNDFIPHFRSVLWDSCMWMASREICFDGAPGLEHFVAELNDASLHSNHLKLPRNMHELQ